MNRAKLRKLMGLVSALLFLVALAGRWRASQGHRRGPKPTSDVPAGGAARPAAPGGADSAPVGAQPGSSPAVPATTASHSGSSPVAPATTHAAGGARGGIASASPWASPEACAAALGNAALGLRRPSAHAPGVPVRVGTWNVRWFPDGRERGDESAGGAAEPRPTHLEWLACAIAALGVDVLALQEIQASPHAQEALAALTSRLGQVAGGQWRTELDPCGGDGRQHVALLYDAERFAPPRFTVYPSLNPSGSACASFLRPGFGGYFRHVSGVDFHLLTVHLKSGTDERSHRLREVTLGGVQAALDAARSVEPDDDVLIAGDFNSMGCQGCAPEVTALDELASWSRSLEGLSPALVRLEPNLPCSEYHRGHAGLLDHFLVARSMRELGGARVAQVAGYCAEASCERLHGTPPRAFLELSDHCPLVVELTSADVD